MHKPPTAVLQLLACPLSRGQRDIAASELVAYMALFPGQGCGLRLAAHTEKAAVLTTCNDTYFVITLAADDTYTVHHVRMESDTVEVLQSHQYVYGANLARVLRAALDPKINC